MYRRIAILVIGCWAVPALAYSFDILAVSELESLTLLGIGLLGLLALRRKGH